MLFSVCVNFNCNTNVLLFYVTGIDLPSEPLIWLYVKNIFLVERMFAHVNLDHFLHC